jgi:hypothetical protein
MSHRGDANGEDDNRHPHLDTKFSVFIRFHPDRLDDFLAMFAGHYRFFQHPPNEMCKFRRVHLRSHHDRNVPDGCDTLPAFALIKSVAYYAF